MDKRNLEKRPGSNNWYVVKEIPRPLRQAAGRKREVRSTGTDSLKEAQRRRAAILAEINQRIEALNYSQGGSTDRWEHYKALAMDIRRRAARGEYALEDETPSVRDGSVIANEVLETENLEGQFGVELTKSFVRIASGKETPLSDLVQKWLSDAALSPQTHKNYYGAVTAFLEWFDGNASVETVSRRKAGEYVTDHLKAYGTQPATINKKVSALSSFWGWLVKRGYAKENPWKSQGVENKPNHRGQSNTEGERPFTDKEVVALLSNARDTIMYDFLLTLLLTGMRRGEAAELSVRDVKDGWLYVREGKNTSALRSIPIHSQLRPIIDRRCQGKGQGEYVFHELSSKGDDRAAPLGKRFTRFRRDVGVHEDSGTHRARVNMHSARRWFITKTEQAGHDPWTVGFVVGHGDMRGGMTLHYSGGPSEGQLRAVVESVQLPPWIAGDDKSDGAT
jgi:integrase